MLVEFCHRADGMQQFPSKFQNNGCFIVSCKQSIHVVHIMVHRILTVNFDIFKVVFWRYCYKQRVKKAPYILPFYQTTQSG